MKTIRSQFKWVTLIFNLIIFFQSCVGYKNTLSAINEIVESGSQVKLLTMDNREYNFKKLVVRDNNLYGVKFRNDRSKDVLLFPSDIQSLKVYDRLASNIVTILSASFVITLMLYGTGVEVN